MDPHPLTTYAIDPAIMLARGACLPSTLHAASVLFAARFCLRHNYTIGFPFCSSLRKDVWRNIRLQTLYDRFDVRFHLTSHVGLFFGQNDLALAYVNCIRSSSPPCTAGQGQGDLSLGDLRMFGLWAYRVLVFLQMMLMMRAVRAGC